MRKILSNPVSQVLLAFVLLVGLATGCEKHLPFVEDQSQFIPNERDTVEVIKDSVRIVIKIETIVKDSIVYRDSVVYRDTTIYRDSVIYIPVDVKIDLTPKEWGVQISYKIGTFEFLFNDFLQRKQAAKPNAPQVVYADSLSQIGATAPASVSPSDWTYTDRGFTVNGTKKLVSANHGKFAAVDTLWQEVGYKYALTVGDSLLTTSYSYAEIDIADNSVLSYKANGQIEEQGKNYLRYEGGASLATSLGDVVSLVDIRIPQAVVPDVVDTLAENVRVINGRIWVDFAEYRNGIRQGKIGNVDSLVIVNSTVDGDKIVNQTASELANPSCQTVSGGIQIYNYVTEKDTTTVSLQQNYSIVFEGKTYQVSLPEGTTAKTGHASSTLMGSTNMVTYTAYTYKNMYNVEVNGCAVSQLVSNWEVRVQIAEILNGSIENVTPNVDGNVYYDAVVTSNLYGEKSRETRHQSMGVRFAMPAKTSMVYTSGQLVITSQPVAGVYPSWRLSYNAFNDAFEFAITTSYTDVVNGKNIPFSIGVTAMSASVSSAVQTADADYYIYNQHVNAVATVTGTGGSAQLTSPNREVELKVVKPRPNIPVGYGRLLSVVYTRTARGVNGKIEVHDVLVEQYENGVAMSMDLDTINTQWSTVKGDNVIGSYAQYNSAIYNGSGWEVATLFYTSGAAAWSYGKVGVTPINISSNDALIQGGWFSSGDNRKSPWGGEIVLGVNTASGDLTITSNDAEHFISIGGRLIAHRVDER